MKKQQIKGNKILLEAKSEKNRALKDDHSNCNWVYGNLSYENGVPRISEDNGVTYHTCIKGTEESLHD